MIPLEPTERFLRGDRVRRRVLGDAHVDRSTSSVTEFTRVWRQLSTEVAWGEFWARPGLDLKTRSICTVAALTALGLPREIRLHIRGALNCGVTPTELAEILIQVGSYAGMPKAADAFQIADEILRERDGQAGT